MRSLISIRYQGFISNVKELNLKNLKNLKSAQSPSLQRPRRCTGVGRGKICQVSVSRLANLSNDCQMVQVCPFLFRSRKLWNIAHGLSEEAQCIQGAILNLKSWLLSSGLSGRLISSSHQCINLVVYLLVVVCAKFGALNRRIYETRSS